MLIPDEIRTKIKWHFKHYNTLRVNWLLRLEDVGSVTTRPLEASGVIAGGPGDPTGSAVVYRDEKTRDLRLWLDIVEETERALNGTPQGDAFRKLYFEGEDVRAVADDLFVSEPTIYRWIGHAIDQAYYLASLKGLRDWLAA